MNELQDKYYNAIQNNNFLILNENDLSLGTKNDKSINSIYDLVMVHKTDYTPQGAIKTSLDTNRSEISTISIKIDGELKKYPIVVKSFRDTVHFSLNGSVKSHSYGDWDLTKYAIMMPLAENKDKIIAGTECDLFTKGSVPLNSSAYILCPVSEIESIKQTNPQVNVVGYEGETVSPYVDVFLSKVLGYKYKEPTENSRNWNHGHSEDHNTVFSIINENNWEYTDHNGSKWCREELRLRDTDVLIQVINIIRNDKLLMSENNIQSVFEVISGRLDHSHLFEGYSFLSDLENKETFEEIANSVEAATGINIRVFVDGTKKEPEVYYRDLQKKLAETIIKQLRMEILKEKEQLGTSTEREVIQLQFEKEFGDWQTALSKGVISKDVINGIDLYQILANNDLSTLNQEELSIILNVINVRLGLLSKEAKDKAQHFELKAINPVTPEMSNIIKMGGNFQKTRDGGIHLTFTAPNLSQQLTELSGVNLSEIDEKINMAKSVEEEYELSKQAALVPYVHADEVRYPYMITDCNLTDCKTPKELSDRVLQYANKFIYFYNGEKIVFDQYGNNITDNVTLVEEPQLDDNNYGFGSR